MTPDRGAGSMQARSLLSDNGPSGFRDHNTGPADAAGSAPLSSHSRFAQRLRRRYVAELPLLPTGTPTRSAMAGTYEALRSRGHDTGTALRILRQLVMERLISLDCDHQAPLALVTRAVTEL